MTLNLLKLCVGVDAVGDLAARIEQRLDERRRRGEPADRTTHTTRMVPKRVEELLAGGSIYWVVKGQIAARQKLLAIEPFTDAEGVSRCRLHLDPGLVNVRPRGCRPFQGWRYLQGDEAPPDLEALGNDLGDLPESLRHELTRLGLL